MAAFGIKAVIHMIVDQGLLGIAHGALDRLQLLREVHAEPTPFDHGDHGAQMPFGAFEPRYDFGVACMVMGVCHTNWIASPRGYSKQGKDPQ